HDTRPLSSFSFPVPPTAATYALPLTTLFRSRDAVAILLAPHPGAEHLPVSQAASGGELSRVMLALEVALSSSRNDRSAAPVFVRSEEHTSELQSRENLVCRLLLEKKKPTAAQ